MRRANVVEKDMASIGTLKDLTNVFESLASTQVAKVKSKAQLSQELFKLLTMSCHVIQVVSNFDEHQLRLASKRMLGKILLCVLQRLRLS